jgi:hypothetical protein
MVFPRIPGSQCPELGEFTSPKPFEVKRAGSRVELYFPPLHSKCTDDHVQFVAIGATQFLNWHSVGIKSQSLYPTADETEFPNLDAPSTPCYSERFYRRFSWHGGQEMLSYVRKNRTGVEQGHSLLPFDLNGLDDSCHSRVFLHSGPSMCALPPPRFIVRLVLSSYYYLRFTKIHHAHRPGPRVYLV